MSLEIPSVSGSRKSKPGHEPGMRVKEGIKAGGETNRSEGKKKKKRKSQPKGTSRENEEEEREEEEKKTGKER